MLIKHRFALLICGIACLYMTYKTNLLVTLPDGTLGKEPFIILLPLSFSVFCFTCLGMMLRFEFLKKYNNKDFVGTKKLSD